MIKMARAIQVKPSQFPREATNDDEAELMRSRAALHLLGEMLEDCGYDMAGTIESTQVARILALSHEVCDMSERLRKAQL